MSDWTLDTLRAHFDERIKHVEDLIRINEERAIERQTSNNTALAAALASAKELVTAAQTAADRAVQKAEVASEKRFESVNEFRAAMGDRERNFMPRSETEAMAKAINEKIDTWNHTFQDKLDAIGKIQAEGRSQKAGLAAGWGWAAAVVALAISALMAIKMFAQ